MIQDHQIGHGLSPVKTAVLPTRLICADATSDKSFCRICIVHPFDVYDESAGTLIPGILTKFRLGLSFLCWIIG